MPRRKPPQPPVDAPSPRKELSPIRLIRTESVLSRFPVHSLSSKDGVEIEILRKNAEGEVVIKWHVSYSDLGAPGRLAYKLDTLIINRKIEAAGRPVPNLICIGTLRDIAEELGLGGDTNEIREALAQNASAFIRMHIGYKTLARKWKTLAANFNRYAVIFTGDNLPDGRKADSVYINLSDVYRSVLNEVPWRPQDYEYLKILTPAAQRFYEIISGRFYGMFRRGDTDGVRIPYSEYCAYAAQHRYFDYDHVKKQMYKVHQPHKESGYLARATFDEMVDAEGRSDWLMTYIPGPKAKHEHDFFTGKIALPEPQPIEEVKPLSLEDQLLVAEMIKRGIDEKHARGILESRAKDQDILEQLEYADWRIANAPAETFHNPTGFYITVLKENTAIPENFDTSRKRRERREQQRQRDLEQMRQLQLENEYDEYKRRHVQRYIEQELSHEERENLIAQMKRACLKQYANASEWSAETLRSVAEHSVVLEVSKRVPLMTMEEFVEMRERQRQSEAVPR
jgi:hypothetical protein